MLNYMVTIITGVLLVVGACYGAGAEPIQALDRQEIDRVAGSDVGRILANIEAEIAHT